MQTARTNLHELARTLSESFRPGDLSPEAKSLKIRTVRLLARGNPVPPAKLADQPEALEELESFAALDFDNERRIVGIAGLSLVPTAHRFTVAGRDLYTWCALDTLFLPALLGEPASVESTCPETGARILLEVAHDGIERVEPSAAVLGVVIPGVTPGVQQSCGSGTCGADSSPEAQELGGRDGAFCTQVHFFSSVQAGSRWLAEHPGAVVLSVEEAYEVGREAFIRPLLEHL